MNNDARTGNPARPTGNLRRRSSENRCSTWGWHGISIWQHHFEVDLRLGVPVAAQVSNQEAGRQASTHFDQNSSDTDSVDRSAWQNLAIPDQISSSRHHTRHDEAGLQVGRTVMLVFTDFSKRSSGRPPAFGQANVGESGAGNRWLPPQAPWWGVRRRGVAGATTGR